MKREFLISVFTIALLLPNTSRGDAKELVGWWPLDEGFGDIARDCSAYKTDGIIYGAKWDKGEGGWALELNEKADFVAVPTRENLQLSDAFTISAWIYPFSVVEGNIVSMTSRYSGYRFSLHKGRINLGLRTELISPHDKLQYPGMGYYIFTTKEPVAKEGEWAFVACSYDIIKDEVCFYVNGSKVKVSEKVGRWGCPVKATKAINTRGKVTYSPYLPITHLLIGSSSSHPGQYDLYTGLIRDVKICNYSLEEGMVKQDFLKYKDMITGLKIVTTEERQEARYTCRIKGNIVAKKTKRPSEAAVYVKVGKQYFISEENIYWGKSGSEKEGVFVAAGKFSVKVPPGEVRIEATRGSEYLPYECSMTLKDKEEKEIVIELERLVDMPSLGWYGGDHELCTWGHGKGVNYGKFMSPQGWQYYADFGKAYGFNYLSHPSFYPKGDYKATWTDRFISYPTVEHQISSIHAGHVGGGKDTVAHMENLIKAGGHGLVQGYGGDDLQRGQVAITMALDKMDVWEVNRGDWYRYLNSGFKCGAGVSSDYYMTYDLVHCFGKEYTKMPKLTWKNMIEAYKRHATFVTGGPLVIFKINDKDIGDNVILTGKKPEEINVSIAAWHIYGVNKIEVIKNGKIEKTFSYSDKPKEIKEEFKLKADKTCWFSVRVSGQEGKFAGGSAYTSPIYVQFGKDPLEARKEDIKHFIGYIEKYRKYLEKNPSGHNKEKENKDADKAVQVYKSLLTKPRTWLDDKPIL